MLRNSKKGSTVILLSIVLVSITAAGIAFSVNSYSKAEESYARSVTDLASRAFLSEYDIRLRDEYGIFAFRGSDAYVCDKVKYYIGLMEEGSVNAFDLEVSAVSADVKEYLLSDIDVFENEITTAAKYGFFVPEKYADSAECSAVLLNESIIAGLPSTQYGARNLKIDFSELTFGDLPNLIASSGNALLVNSYAFDVFSFKGNKLAGRNSFFDFEIEYIVAGKHSDAENLRKVRTYLVELRTPVNIAKIYADPARSAEALALAETLTPGPAAIATQLAIITAWAVADAEKEADMILNGEKVDGLGYKEYLAIFLSIEERETKLYRIMDLIQLNMKGSYYGDFLIKDHAVGFGLDIEMAGKTAHYEHAY